MEGNYGCAKQYKCALGIYLFTVLSYLYGVIMDHAINAPGHRNNVVDGLNDTKKYILRNIWNF